MTECNIPDHEIAIATGSQRELDNINLFNKSCLIRYIITVQALKEGWDCSFAYVFCSTQKVNSNKDAEQLLGRVLRMPYAKRRLSDKLNQSYAHLNSPNFAQAALQIKDALIKDMGFEAWEADNYIEQSFVPNLDIDNNEPVFFITLETEINNSYFSETEQQAIEIIKQDDNRVQLKISGEVSQIMETAILNTISKPQEQEIIKLSIQKHNNRYYGRQAPSQRGEVFKAVPYLQTVINGELVLLEPNTFLRLAQWDILSCPAELFFIIDEKDDVVKIDIDEGSKKVVYDFVDKQQSIDYDAQDCPINESDFALELDKIIRSQRKEMRINQPQMIGFLIRVLDELQHKKAISLTALWRHKFLLVNAILNKLDNHREKTAQKSFQELLFNDDDAIIVPSQKYFFNFNPHYYPARKPYHGGFRFKKHFYAVIDDLKEGGEEFECAKAIERHEQVKHWVRNLVQADNSSVWLPLSNGKFYPDFIVELHDGRLLIVEYKGKHLIDSSTEKLAIGKAFAKSNNALFLMAVKQDEQGRNVYQQLDNTIK
jgi:type III restriction enzyme